MHETETRRSWPVVRDQGRGPLKVLVLSRNYPNRILDLLGLWVERLVRQSRELCEPKVIAPVPYAPPLPKFADYYGRFRRIERHRWADGIEVFHPRFLTGPGYSLHSMEALTYYLGIRRDVDQLSRRFRFDVIHAHFSYPDGVVAARLGRRYGVPVIITEQAPWRPWMEEYPLVRRQALWAARESAFLIAISRYVKDTIAHLMKDTKNVRVIPDGVDGSVFTPAEEGHRRNPNQILFIGQIFYNKGIDLLLKAMVQLAARRPEIRLVLVGGNAFRNKQVQEERLKRMAIDLGLDGRVEFVGTKPLHELVRYLRESSLLVLPSRAESFGCVLVEALACGVPVVATRCGGPEDIVTDDVGVLVPPEDVNSLAEAILSVLEKRETYDPAHLRRYALEKFSWECIARQTVDLYYEALERFVEKDDLRTIPGSQT